jgi:ribosome modulation factor
MRPEPTMLSYKKGYNDGLNTGISNNPYDGMVNPKLHTMYRQGYDAGVADYCREVHPKDEE